MLRVARGKKSFLKNFSQFGSAVWPAIANIYIPLTYKQINIYGQRALLKSESYRDMKRMFKNLNARNEQGCPQRMRL